MVNYLSNLSLTLLCLLLIFFPVSELRAARLDGQILLQVQEKGEAWYVNPLNTQRYYLGRPADAFAVMRSLGLGVSDKDIGSYQVTKAPARLSGRILLQVQDEGQAFYVKPDDLKLYYLGRPQDAFYLMRSFGLGITNSDLAKIKIFQTAAMTPISRNSDYEQIYNFKFKNIAYAIKLELESGLYNNYRQLQKSYSFPSNSDLSIMRNVFYGNFLTLNKDDKTIKNLVSQAQKIAMKEKWSEDESLEFLLALVQHIPYDLEKVLSGTNNNPFFPYETLYLNRGVCSDKSFLALLIARELNYGAAILDFPDLNHSALGLACPKEDSVRNSGYCFLETTNYFPPGVIPLSINEGQAEKEGADLADLFSDTRLGKMEIYQETTGKIYRGLSAVKEQARKINLLSQELAILLAKTNDSENVLAEKEQAVINLKKVMDEYLLQNKLVEYNALIANYNSAIKDYNAYLAVYKQEIEHYNEKANSYNFLANSFYQK